MNPSQETRSSSVLAVAELVAEAEAAAGDDADRAIHIARRLLERSRQLQTPQERRQQAELDRMIGHPDDKATLVEMTDQAFRTLTPARVADQLTHILDLQGVPRFFSPLERTMLRGFQSFGEYLPGVAVPLVKDKMRRETANVILPAEEDLLRDHLQERQREGLRMNVNFLGEALLGEEDAHRRLDKYLAALRLPEVECISVKISTIYSQISPLARDHTVEVVADRLEMLYRAAGRETFRRADGAETSKFVYLDMEEYRDLHLTAAALRRALDREGLESIRAGIALQAYIPDSFAVLKQLVAWARGRVAAGGTPLTVRLVKGANLEMERVEAALGGWPQAPYESKRDTDANFKRMLREMLAPASSAAVRLGVASHNLFDVALAMLWSHRAGAADRVQYEMLEGMANQQRRALFEAAHAVLLYAPACRRDEFLNAIGYLVRRLDENTGEENFLRYAFRLQDDTPEWTRLVAGFRESLARVDVVSTEPRRRQNRTCSPEAPPVAQHWSTYVGEPDTDWSLPVNTEWARSLVASWQAKCDAAATTVPLTIAGREQEPGDRVPCQSFDPSRPDVVVCRYWEAVEEDVERAVDCAEEDPLRWRETSLDHRQQLLRAAAQLMRVRRGDLIGAAMADGGKTMSEADAEVSEAIDFTEFYPLTVAAFEQRTTVQRRPRGVVAVVSPWNFPLAIPCGGVAAALAAGNTVILKPASDTVLPAYHIARCCWDAGVPPEVLQLIPCAGARGGQRLIEDRRVAAVILTGGTATARQMLASRPAMHLIAETGGKNATIVTALSDRDLAIKNVIHSAFSHGGQKCSATSLLLLEDEVYEDRSFRETLADAVRSLRVGQVWDLSNRLGPLIRPPRAELARGMKELEPGETWLVMPERVTDNPRLYRPGVKWNVRPGGFTHRTELFGPVLGVMRYRRLEDAIGIVNATGYGLTSGLESLDDREQELWRRTIRAGNLYINRPTTGAIVLRQPFGGVGNSAYGPGVKAGGPHYVLPLMHVSDRQTTPDPDVESSTDPQSATTGSHGDDDLFDDDLSAILAIVEQHSSSGLLDPSLADRMRKSIDGLRRIAADEFAREHDSVRLLGQDNMRRYCPVRQMRLRLTDSEQTEHVLTAVSAAVAVRSALTISYDHGSDRSPASQLLECLVEIAERLPGRVELLEETEHELAASIRADRVDRLRLLGPDRGSDLVREACGEAFVSVIDEPVVADGYIEGLRYVSEQSISHSYHRYGNLGRRGPSRTQ